jgi:hypothetical protein
VDGDRRKAGFDLLDVGGRELEVHGSKVLFHPSAVYQLHMVFRQTGPLHRDL